MWFTGQVVLTTFVPTKFEELPFLTQSVIDPFGMIQPLLSGWGERRAA